MPTTKVLLIILLTSLFYIPSFAQKDIQISDVQVRYRYFPEEMPPVSVFDSAYSERKVEMEILFKISDVANLKEIELKEGEKEGGAEYMNGKMAYIRENNKDWLSYEGKLYEIKNNIATITQLVPEELSRKTMHISIKALDKRDNQSNTASKKIN